MGTRSKSGAYKNQCPSTIEAPFPRPLPDPVVLMVNSGEMATHQCSVTKGHRAAHYCGCGYEWTDETRRVLLDNEGGHDD